jgi:hypothetical protein
MGGLGFSKKGLLFSIAFVPLKHLIPIAFPHKEADFLYPLPFFVIIYEIKTM